MKTIVAMNQQGRLTVPAVAREARRLQGSAHFELEVTEGALILRPVAVVPRDDAWAHQSDHIRRVGRARQEYRERGSRQVTEAELKRLATP